MRALLLSTLLAGVSVACSDGRLEGFSTQLELDSSAAAGGAATSSLAKVGS